MTAHTASARTGTPVKKRDTLALIGQFAPLIFLIILIVIFATLQPNFLNPRNLFNVMRQVAITGMIAIGMTFVILTGGIDLSVGSILALAGMVAAVIFKGGNQNTLTLNAEETAGYGVAAAAAGAMIVGSLCGLIQGFVITRFAIPAFVVTLGGMSIFRGATLILSNGGPISGFDEAYRFWGSARIPDQNGIPVSVLIFLGFALLAHVVLTYTRYGRHIYAVGGNPEAARLSGLNVRWLVLSVYVIVGFFAGLAGFVLSSQLNSSEAVAGDGYELRVIASVVIGGTSLFGGEGSVLGTLIGAMLIGVLINGLVLMNVSSYVQQIIIGVIIVLAVGFDRFIKSRRR
ncbi:MAG: ABC transporter permease [Candidatus Flexifilum sp.]|jgi:ribose/xylose/arabinose/galactoside ABC-type transport system permease subunit